MAEMTAMRRKAMPARNRLPVNHQTMKATIAAGSKYMIRLTTTARMIMPIKCLY